MINTLYFISFQHHIFKENCLNPKCGSKGLCYDCSNDGSDGDIVGKNIIMLLDNKTNHKYDNYAKEPLILLHLLDEFFRGF